MWENPIDKLVYISLQNLQTINALRITRKKLGARKNEDY
jgi:hypothetical protein